jgi:nicotinate phosphoribosyltransferase
MTASGSESSFLFADLYELTMACGYWKSGRAEREAVFHLVFRENPFGGGFSIACGLTQVLNFLKEFRLSASDRDYLASLKGNDQKPLFPSEFLDYLSAMRIRCDIDAIPEGTAVFPQEPLIRVRGPLAEAQILESLLLNIINFQTLIATKGARLAIASQERNVLEFGLRRAQGINGSLAASRAAYVGGCDGTSNTLAGKLYGIPTVGTHAHSWIMSFDTEQEAFDAYAEAFPNNTIFLVDTYDTREGVARAIKTAQRMRTKGREPIGVRLDSGDLRELSLETRRQLDDAGFPEVKIVASGDLDEYSVTKLIKDGAPIDTFGVGTKLVTAYDDPALGGVYKLSAIEDRRGQRWPKVKVSNDPAKISNPGCLQLRRLSKQGKFVGDIIYDEKAPPSLEMSDGLHDHFGDLLVPVLRAGRLVYEMPSLEESRQRAIEQLASLSESVKSFDEPEVYPVRLENDLASRKDEMVRKIRNK